MLEEKGENMDDQITKYKKCMKRFFEKREKWRRFVENDLVLLWYKRCEPKGMHHKFEFLWKGPFKIGWVNQKNSFIFSYPIGEILPFSYNG